MNTPDYQRQTYLFICNDPVHVGTGGYRLGRVDNSIVREPGTNIPKIPGTSLHGAARMYAASINGNTACAGQGRTLSSVSEKEAEKSFGGVNSAIVKSSNATKSGHCGTCPVCYTFGYANTDDEQSAAYSGTVNVFDAHILLFPVHSMVGPVWVTTCSRLETILGVTLQPEYQRSNCDKVNLVFDFNEPFINLGWIMLEVEKTEIDKHHIELTDVEKKFGLNSQASPNDVVNKSRWEEIKKRIVIVHESLFSPIVNSNLEVRTSVAIDPERGAAEDKALFTYEALPRTTILAADVVVDDYRNSFSETQNKNHQQSWASPLDVLDAGLRLIEWLGVGGMGTRGFGRMSVLGRAEETFNSFANSSDKALHPKGE